MSDAEGMDVTEDSTEYSPPPKTFWKTIAALGPGIILASSIVGVVSLLQRQ